MLYQSGSSMDVYWDGEIVSNDTVKIDFFSQALHYGNGVIEGMRAYRTVEGTRIFKAHAHFERLCYSAARMRIPVRHSIQEMINIAYDLLDHRGLREAYIRPMLIAGSQVEMTSPNSSILAMAAWKPNPSVSHSPIQTMLSSFRRPDPSSGFPDAKIVGQYAHSVIALNEARSCGFHDALLLDQSGHLAQATSSNLFVEKDDVLYTPQVGSIMPGITREVVMEMAGQMGVPVCEENLHPDFLKTADAAFLCGTANEILGIQSFNRRPFPTPWEDSIGYAFARKYRQQVTLREGWYSTLI
ncbi:aminotransferase class IV [Pontibacter sp. G13]|uniref:aminotransferase class IV n=1 Tax=Pontibacter sp. G13 TaxID=3074898 RepID=UPI00288ABE95|nr:aminotransferase class IV [Pontibacter sp. G13]WNJ18747.1 aminotransferase class IV [Pontibacter sp. G13]